MYAICTRCREPFDVPGTLVNEGKPKQMPQPLAHGMCPDCREAHGDATRGTILDAYLYGRQRVSMRLAAGLRMRAGGPDPYDG